MKGSADDGRKGNRPSSGHAFRPAKDLRRQVDRRRGAGHAQPLARPGDHLGLPGRQGRLRREARPRTISSKAARWSRRRGSTSASCSTARNAAPVAKIREGIEKLKAGVIGRVYMARGIAFKVRAGGRNKFEPVPAGHALGPLARPGPAADYNELLHQPLAISEELRQRRDRRPGRPPVGHHPLGPRPETHPDKVQSMGGPLRPPDDDEDTPGNQSARQFRWNEHPAGPVRDPRLVHQHRGRHGRRVSVRRSPQRGGRDLLRHATAT